MANGRYRTHRDMGLKRTVEWLAKWYRGPTEVLVECFSIRCPDIAMLSRADAKQLDRLRSRNQSELHAYLKFAALKWLEENSSYPDTIASEVICYFPNDELCEGRIVTDEHGREIDIRAPQVLYDNADNFPLSYGHTIRADLHSFDISIEVGATEPFSLLMPLLDRLAEQAVWLPYPWGKDPTSFQHSSAGLGCARAYAIKLRE